MEQGTAGPSGRARHRHVGLTQPICSLPNGLTGIVIDLVDQVALLTMAGKSTASVPCPVTLATGQVVNFDVTDAMDTASGAP